jgi:hypothetical protein
VEKATKLGIAVGMANKIINDVTFMLENRLKSTYFTRTTEKMDFKDLITFALNLVKKTIQIELDSYFRNIKGAKITMTKQAYSQARQKISPNAFRTLDKAIIEWYYQEEYKTFMGYRLLAIDGTVMQLNNSERLREAFGYAQNVSMDVARASSGGVYDLENDMMITSKITHYLVGERELAVELIEQLKDLSKKDDLILFDRGYPSTDLIKYLEKNRIKYLMRVSTGFLKAIYQTTEPDSIIDIKSGREKLRIRVIKLMLDSGIEEILITNLMEESLDIEGFKQLYFKRWGIEVKFGELKSRLQIENFTGDTKIAVEQDFYASIYLSNMAALAKQDANQEIKEKNECKNLKYEYKVNTNILIGKLKDDFIKALLEDNAEKRKKMINKIMQDIKKNTIPIRPGRSYERKMFYKANDYSLNKKRCL